MNTGSPAAFRPSSRLRHLTMAVLPVLVAAAVGTAATIPNIPGWYQALAKPPFTPPNTLFGPAWTILYVMMAVAFSRVLAMSPATPGRREAVGWFIAQLALNALWSVLFFGAHAPIAAAFDIVLLDVAVVSTIRHFARIDRTAALLLVPYAAWILFATYLNAGIVRLNP